LEDHGQVPPPLQKEVHATVAQTRQRSEWPAKKTLAALGIARRTYYRWLKEEKWAQELPAAPPRPVQPYEALAEEKQAVVAYALKHPELRHRELAWRMVDEDVACLSASTVYRILKEAKLVCPWRRRSKRHREEDEKATRPNQIWATDVMYVQVAATTYFFVSFLDEYSRYVVHHELLLGMDGVTVSLAAQAAIDTLAKGPDGLPLERPLIRSDNGSGYVSKEFKMVLKENGLDQQRIKPHCPEENGVIERSNRTLREQLDGEELKNLVQAQGVMSRIIRRYNDERLHSALGYLPPVDYYRGDPRAKHEARRVKLARARHRRRERNLQLQQGTLPYTAEGPVANP
jgi:transposase InsO family protein